jgi:uncharacterized protein YceK
MRRAPHSSPLPLLAADCGIRPLGTAGYLGRAYARSCLLILLVALGVALAACGSMQPRVSAYPGRGQSPTQTVQDREECQGWAWGELKRLYPTIGGTPVGPSAGHLQASYDRAYAACMIGRGYVVQ